MKLEHKIEKIERNDCNVPGDLVVSLDFADLRHETSEQEILLRLFRHAA